MFEDEVIESFTLPEFPQFKIYRIGGDGVYWVAAYE